MKTRDAILAALEKIRSDLHERFPSHVDRLAQLDSSIGTASMVVSHIHDEAAKQAQEVK